MITEITDNSFDDLETPDVSLFIPIPGAHSDDDSKSSSDTSQVRAVMKLVVPNCGLRLERYTIHQGRFGSLDDSSLLEALVQSAFDNFKSVRIVADGSESVHSFISALSEEFLNFADAVEVQDVWIRKPVPTKYSCAINAVYPSVPRFRHLAKTYSGVAESDRSALHASLSAACCVVGNILLTLQPEGFQIPASPSSSTCSKQISPIPSTIDSPKKSPDFGAESIISESSEGGRKPLPRSKFTRVVKGLFLCGGKR
jgi:hypothetical protein